LCADGVFCNGEEICDITAGCISGTPVNCSDGIECTIDTCNEETDACENSPQNSLCDDGLFCNGTEICDIYAGCISGSPPDCSDGIECTTDSCNEEMDLCENTPQDSLCIDELFCTVNERCDANSGCIFEERNCSDEIDCTQDFCSEEEKTCLHLPQNEICDDSNECTDDLCNIETGCQNLNVPDGMLCGLHDGTQICVSGECVERRCGDGYVEPLNSEYGAEECDDGNLEENDSCTADCHSIDFQVNTTESGEQKNPRIAFLSDCSFVIVFEDETYSSPSYTDVRMRLFDRFGNPVSTTDSLISESSTGVQNHPSVAPIAGGGFAVAWADEGGAGADLFEIKLRIFDSSGIGSRTISVNTITSGSQTNPFVLTSSDKIFVFWDDWSNFPGEIKFRRFGFSGHPLDSVEKSVSGSLTSMVYSGEPSSALTPDGGFIVVWTGSTDGRQTGVFGKIFDSNSNPVSQIFEISSSECNQNYSASTSWYGEISDGVFVVVWERICSGGSPEIASAIIDPYSASVFFPPITISPQAEESFSPQIISVKALVKPDGSLEPPSLRWISMLLWAGEIAETSSPQDAPYDIYAWRFIVEGNELLPFDESPRVISTTTRFEQSEPTGAFCASGNFAISWKDLSFEGSDTQFSSIRSRYLPNGWLITE